MKKLIRRAAITCAATLALLPATFSAQAESVNRAEVETIIKEYLVANPEIVLEALQELDKRRLAEEESARKGAISSLSDEIYNSDYQIVLGNPDGDVTLVELFDYNCGYCKRALSDLVRLVDEDKNLRVVLKEFLYWAKHLRKLHALRSQLLKLHQKNTRTSTSHFWASLAVQTSRAA